MESHNLISDIDETLEYSCHVINIPEEINTIITHEYTFRLLTYNIRSINKNFDNFRLTLARMDTQVDVIVLTECWLRESLVINQLDGYNVFRTMKQINKSGGVVIYVKNCWDVISEEPTLANAECLTIEIPKIITVVGVYRTPSISVTEEFLSSLASLLDTFKNNREVIFAGDININIIPNIEEDPATEYLCLTAEQGFLPAITKPTRGRSCLDHIFVKSGSLVVSVVCSTAITDHEMCIAGINILGNTKKKTKIITKIDYPAITDEIRAIDWSIVTNSVNVNDAVKAFTDNLTTIINKNTRKIRISNSKIILKPWITSGLLRCIKHRDNLHLKVIKCPNDVILKISYLRYRTYCNNLLHTLKQAHETSELSRNSNNPKKLWSTVKDICNIKKKNCQATALLSSKARVDKSLDYCNEYFSEVGNKLANSTLTRLNQTQDSLAMATETLMSSSCHSFFMKPTDPLEVNRFIQQVKSEAAPGLDGFSGSLIKCLREHILQPLTFIINLSISTGDFPDAWKQAAITPIHKDGAKDDPCNFRPIALLSVFSKIIEKIVNSRLVNYIETHNLLSDRQFGFRQKRSTEDAVQMLTNFIDSYLDSGKRCVGVFLDLAKAFDTVSIPIMLSKLHNIGIRGLPNNWFQSYLTIRTQSVKIGSQVSAPRTVKFGVPQGSILGPTLFLIYINDIASLFGNKTEVVCYADDTALLFNGVTWQETFEKVEDSMCTIAKWLDHNLLTLNAKKTKYLCFSKTNASAPASTPPLKIHKCGVQRKVLLPNCQCETIGSTRYIRYLGVLIDDHLSFKPHLNLLVTRIRKLIYIMKPLRGIAPEAVLKMVYLGLGESILSYCIPVWGGARKTNMLSVERAQRSLLKVMYRKPFQYPTTSLYEECQFLTVRQLYIFKSTLKMHTHILKTPALQELLNKRIFRIPVPPVKTSFSQCLARFLHPFLYNRISQNCEIKFKPYYHVKYVIKSWLSSLSYCDTEKLLEVIS